MLKSLGISIIPASAPDFFTEDTPTAVLVRQVLGAISQFEKASAVAKLAGARKRKRERERRCEGRSHSAQRGQRLSRLLASCGVESPRVGNCRCVVSQVNWKRAAISTSVGSPTLQSLLRPCSIHPGDQHSSFGPGAPEPIPALDRCGRVQCSTMRALSGNRCLLLWLAGNCCTPGGEQ
jgi:hypothetical protein